MKHTRQRSTDAEQYRRLYKTARWKERRRWQLVDEPLCQWCIGLGKVVPASVAHHATPHRGDHQAFYFGELVSLCKHCHDSLAQSIERLGYDDTTGADGWPVDPVHPDNLRG